jgi:hypothetical protein
VRNAVFATEKGRREIRRWRIQPVSAMNPVK